MIEPRYKIKKVVALTGESPKRIYAGLHRGEFPGACKNGGQGRTSTWIIPESAIEHFLALR